MRADIPSRRSYSAPRALTVLAAVLYASVSITNHVLFRTAALDLGAYTNALYDYARFHLNDSTTFKVIGENLLAGHFDLMLMVLSPLSWVFGSFTLLIAQLAAVLFGGWGVYRFLRLRNQYGSLPVWGMAFYYFYFAVFSALSFDYHSKVIAASLLPWFFYFIEKDHLRKAGLVLLGVIICQESQALWMVFVTTGAAFLYRNRKGAGRLLYFGGFSILWFSLITVWVMPALSNAGIFYQFRYSILGSNYGEAFHTLFTEPLKILRALFLNTSGDPLGDYVKSECWWFLFFSGGVLLLFRPVWLFMLIPVFFQKFLHDQVSMWGVNGQYAIEFAPVVTLGAFEVIAGIKKERFRKIVLVMTMLGCAGTTLRLMDRTSAFVPKSQVRIYQAAHWESAVNRKSVCQAIGLIPEKAVVSAYTFFVPHLALRDRCYAFPIIKDAEYVLFPEGGNPYPVSQEAYDALTDSLTRDVNWKTVFYSDGIRLLQRIH